METNLQDLLNEIKELEKSIVEQIVEQMKKKEGEILFKIHNRSVIFQKDVAKKHAAFRKSIFRFLAETSVLSYMVAPIIYSMILPAVILDAFTCVYQFICFPVYGIPKVSRAEYISLDRRKLRYLNLIERINCDYCGYFNGVIAFVREVAARTEQFFCPIRHALKTKGLHARHSRFLAYGEANEYSEKLIKIREQLKNTNSSI